MSQTQWLRFVVKPIIFLVCLIPLGVAVAKAFDFAGGLGANPIEALLDHFGNWGLRFLLIALAVTPLQKLLKENRLLRFRRMLGLFAFFYVLLHFVVYAVLDQSLALADIVEDVIERPFITFGMLALTILLALTLTSTSGMRRRMGARWQQLHYGAYVAAILAVWHFWWQVKKDITEPAIYVAILASLLLFRLASKRRRARIRKLNAI